MIVQSTLRGSRRRYRRTGEYHEHEPARGAGRVDGVPAQVRCSRNGVTEWHARDANCLRFVFSLFSGCFRVVCEAFPNADRHVPSGDTHARERDGEYGTRFRYVF